MEEKSKFLRTYVLQDFETFVKIHPDRSRHVFWRGGMFKTYVHMSHSPNAIHVKSIHHGVNLAGNATRASWNGFGGQRQMRS